MLRTTALSRHNNNSNNSRPLSSLSTSATAPTSPSLLHSIKSYFSLKYYQYELTYALYMLEPWEKAIISKKWRNLKGCWETKTSSNPLLKPHRFILPKYSPSFSSSFVSRLYCHSLHSPLLVRSHWCAQPTPLFEQKDSLLLFPKCRNGMKKRAFFSRILTY